MGAVQSSPKSSSHFMAHITSFEIDEDGQSYENLGTRIKDLPEEVLTMIFMELDSVTRKKIRRVCRKWCKILQGVKVLRTHVKLESLDVSRIGLDCLLKNYIMSTPEVEVLHIDGSGIPKTAYPERSVDLYLPSLLAALRKGMSTRNADLFLTNGSFEIPLDSREMDTFKRIVVRKAYIFPHVQINWLEAISFPFKNSKHARKWFGELILNLVDDPHQLIHIYLNDSGPLTEFDNNFLTERCARYTYDFFSSLERLFARIGVNLNLRGLLKDVAAGRSIPKFIADMLAGYLRSDNYLYIL